MKSLLLSLLVSVGSLSAQSLPEAKLLQLAPDTHELMHHLRFLASDSCAGRASHTEGAKRAAQYISKVWSNQGLKTGFQPFSLSERLPNQSTMFLVAGSDTLRSGLTSPGGFSPGTYFIPEMVAIGRGFDTLNMRDFSKRVKGKLVLFDGTFEAISSVEKEWLAYPELRLRAAKKYGAVAAFFLGMPPAFEPVMGSLDRKAKLRFRDDFNATSIPYGFIQPEVVSWIKAHKKGFYLHVQQREPQGVNVWATLPGTDLAHEYVVISAHYDHLGTRAGKTYYGADDNASGTSALLTISRVFSTLAKQGLGPRRSLLFIAFSGEEMGLLGSAFYVKQPVFPLSQVVLNLNIDMIGRNDEAHHLQESYLYLIGSDRISPGVHRISDSLLQDVGFTADYHYNDPDHPMRLYERSDHYSFCEKGIPAIFYFSGLHADYHTPQDTWDKIQPKRLKTNTQVILHSAWIFANRVRLDW